MRKTLFRICSIITVACVLQQSVFSCNQVPQQPGGYFSREESSLKGFLQDYVSSKDDDKTTRYAHAFVDLNDDGRKEAIVYLLGRLWCGSGGCMTLVLQAKDSSYETVTRITITQLPIRVLNKTTNGWRNISVLVRGGAMEPTYEAELCFDGKSYPNNPSVPPARRLRTKKVGQVVVPLSAQIGAPLFP
jgi:hypothetical protein